MVKYKQSRESADQSKLVIEKTGEMRPVRAKAKVEVIYKESPMVCPYCLFQAAITKFLIKLKSGRYSEKRVMCPDCGKIMNMQTLTREMTVEEFAAWVLDTMAWERISFDKFKRRLKEMGISFQFWAAYHKHKEEAMAGREEEEEHYDRSQREWAEEEGLVDEHG